MRCSALTVGLCLLFSLPVVAVAQEAGKPVTTDKPIRALLVTGGCCHDYARQKLILSRGISARANVVWTVAHQGGTTTNTPIPVYDDPNWSKGFDIVVHNECFSDVRDKQFVENIVRPHREGLPAILIHCAMHCYRVGDDQWFEFVGMQSPGHGPHYSYTVDNKLPTHPIMKDFGTKFVAPKGELYHSIKLFETATVLGQANRQSDSEPQTCIWTNQYGKGRVFATTIGHYNETMSEPKYLDMLTRGLLWACDRDVEAAFHPTTGQTDEEIRKLIDVVLEAPSGKGSAQLPLKCCGEGNLAVGGKTSASSEESGKQNFAKNAVDGDLRTRWCANGPTTGQTWQVDLGSTQHIQSLRIHWEHEDSAYRYRVDASPDGEEWKTVVNAADNKEKQKITPHIVDAPDTRFLRVTYLGASSGSWGSFWEFEAYASKELPELPKNVVAAPAGGSNASIADVEAPDGFNVTLFGHPPEVNYPVCLAAAATGELFVGVDEQGSLGKESGRGKVLRCIDTDGDGKADRINVFAKMDHPRGLFYDNGSLWVLHPPTLSVFHDDDRDGTADRQDTLISGISTDEVEKRGADHTTNGIRMGIDGWLYIAVGDFGFVGAKGADGTVLSRRGGGIVRIRPDGSEMEIHNWGQRNILDVCIDPYMNIFTRDNTNDGGGWDIRLSHILQSGEYGYPSLYLNFTEESLPPLADFGGGSGCGGMYLHDLRWPSPFADAVYTCDWGRSEVYRHNLPANGATFDAHQEVFVKIPRPTDIDIDGSGRMYVSSWKNGQFAYAGPDIGFVAQITPIDFTPKPFPDLNAAPDAELVEYLSSPSAVYRQHSQLALLRRGVSESRVRALLEVAARDSAPPYGRAAAIYTLKQLAGVEANAPLLKLAQDDEVVREVAFRAVTDRRAGLDQLPLDPFMAGLSDGNPRVRAQALICLGRIGRSEAGEAILPLTERSSHQPRPTDEPLYRQPDPGRVIPHLAVRALVNASAVEACVKAIDGPYSEGALWALRGMHSEAAVSGLFGRLSQVRNLETRKEILTTLIRLYFREGDYKGGWWGTRPDRTGPYYDRQKWSESDRIAEALKVALSEADEKLAAHIQEQLARHLVKLDGTSETSLATTKEAEKAIVVPKVDPANPNQIGNLEYATVLRRALAASGNVDSGKALFMANFCVSCHTYANGQNPKGPHLVDIGKRYKPEELVESIVDPSKKIAQGFDTFKFFMLDGKEHTGFVVQESAETVIIRRTDGLSTELLQEEIDERVKLENSMMPKGVAGHLTPEQLADLMAFLQLLH